MKILLPVLMLLSGAAWANEGAPLAKQNWSFTGVRADWNKDELYRGYTVATQVCLACHSFKYISHRDLMRVGFTEAEVKTMAANLKMTIDQPIHTGLAETDAQELYGKVPPDLSLMTKAREGLADYVYGVLTGYSEKPEEIAKDFPTGLPKGAYYNHAFPGKAIAMPAPLSGPDMVSFHDNTAATVPQMAHDVVTFMQWTAEPERMERQRLGVFVLLYLIIFGVLTYFTKRAVWRDVH
ncbi:MAG TPA: cytochrome c1 [Alphaproteobacteria bacterium]|nr:cytochrome c1 [Alphaproteobacteria bacterium]